MVTYGIKDSICLILRNWRLDTVAHNCHSKLKFFTANSNSPRQIQIHHSKFKIRHGKFKFTRTANSKSLVIARFATGVGLVLGGFGLVLVVCTSFFFGGGGA